MFGSFAKLPPKEYYTHPMDDNDEDDYSDDGFEDVKEEVEGKEGSGGLFDLNLEFGGASNPRNPASTVKSKTRAVKSEVLMRKRRKMMEAYSASPAGEGRSAKIVSGKMKEKSDKAKKDVLKKGKRHLAQSKKRRKEERKAEVRSDKDQSDEMATQSLATKIAHTRTFAQDAPPSQLSL